MSLRISGKHMEIGDAFRSRIRAGSAMPIEKYFDGGFSGHVTVQKSGPRFSADCVIFLDTGMGLQAAGQAYDPQAAFEAASDRIETACAATSASCAPMTAARRQPALDQDIAYRGDGPGRRKRWRKVPEDFGPRSPGQIDRIA